MGFSSKATVSQAKSIARVVAPPDEQIFQPTGAKLVQQGGVPIVPVPGWTPPGAQLVQQGGLPTTSWPLALPGLVAWYDASQLTGLSDNDPVTTWTDLSGNGRNLTQGTAANKPLYKTSIQNGLPMLRFDGTNDFMDASFVATQPMTIIACIIPRLVNKPGTSNYWDGLTVQSMLCRENGTAFEIYAGIVLGSGTVAVNTTYVMTTIYNGASSLIRLNQTGASGNAGTNGGADPTGLRVASAGGAGSSFGQNDYGEIVVCSGALSSANYTSTEGYIRGKWGF